MNRKYLAILGILICSANVFGQGFSAPKNNNPLRVQNTGFAPPTNSGFASVKSTAKIEPVSSRKPISRFQDEEQPAANTNQGLKVPQEFEPVVDLPAPKKEAASTELKEDKQTYSSSANRSGVSAYQLAVARQRAQARRMRIEAKKWHGIDSARPTVPPRVDISVYSGYYNGVYSRYGYPYGQGTSYAPNFYYSFPMAR